MTAEAEKVRRGRPLSVAERKRRQRARLQESGFTPVEVWIPAQHRPFLRRVEQLLRRGIVPALDTSEQLDHSGKRTMDIKLLRETLDGFTSENGFAFAAEDAGAEDAIEITVEDRQEFPIIVTADDEQILCLTYLWSEDQVKKDGRMAMMATLLEMNVPLPLSSFGKIGDRYVVFGALAANAAVEDVVTELEVLSDNTLEAIEIASPFLN